MRVRNSLILCYIIVAIYFVVISENYSVGNELTPEWHTSASCKIILSVKDKWNTDKPFRAKYVVKLSRDIVFIAEKDGGGMNQVSTKVIFPDDFFIPETNQKAWSDFNGKESVWEIYVDDELMETGTFSFKRSMMD